MTLHEKFARTLIPTLFCGCLLTLSVADTADARTSRFVSEALPAELGETVRGEGLGADTPDCYRFETPEAGLLLLDVAVPGTAQAEPRLGLQGRRGLTVIEQSATYVLAATDGPQSLVACVGAQDPTQRLGDFKLLTAFQAAPDLPSKTTEPIEAEPDPFVSCGLAKTTEPIEAEPDPFVSCGLAGKALAGLCQSGDDHADAFHCATSLAFGQSVTGTIENGWGDDHDLFSFRLDAPRTVRVEAMGEGDVSGALYDRNGQRLASAGSAGSAGFRLVKALPAGVYFVRVEAEAWAQVAYALAVDTLVRSW